MRALVGGELGRKLVGDARHVGAGQEIDTDIGAEHLVDGGLVARRALDAGEGRAAPTQRERALLVGGGGKLLQRRIDALRNGGGAGNREQPGNRKA